MANQQPPLAHMVQLSIAMYRSVIPGVPNLTDAQRMMLTGKVDAMEAALDNQEALVDLITEWVKAGDDPAHAALLEEIARRDRKLP